MFACGFYEAEWQVCIIGAPANPMRIADMR
jgi:hypothetical protein